MYYHQDLFVNSESAHSLEWTSELKGIKITYNSARAASSSSHWPGAANHSHWEPRSAEPVDAVGKQTGLACQGPSLQKQRNKFGNR
ncbi:hypothetical protein UY3_05973 [Chelonia mydas]|uniref:Uncharacterized protein n=1 Tax=Chelonia mydas TaxID=8469 RepID=M7BI80_CHEMY|nr:hypothetical protein UY3_05973 [Chelonia mydas]